MGVGVRTASGLEGEGRLKGWGGWNGGGLGWGGETLFQQVFCANAGRTGGPVTCPDAQ